MIDTVAEARAPADSDDVKEILAMNIVANRKRLGLSRAELARKIGITMAAVGQYERGTRLPQIDIICKLANVFNVPVDTLVGHNNAEYDAVLEYRFERAVNTIERRRFFVVETPEGSIRICDPKEKTHTPEFHYVNGVVSAIQDTTKNTTELETLLEFSDRKSFVCFFEYFFELAIPPREFAARFYNYVGDTARQVLLS